nr:penicillin-binding protein 1B-like [Nerophis lumbriciformis]
MARSQTNKRRRWLLGPFLFLLGLGMGFALPYGWQLDRLLTQRLALIESTPTKRLFGRPLTLINAGSLSNEQLLFELKAAGYQAQSGSRPGTYQRTGDRITIRTRGDSRAAGGHFSFRLRNGIVADLQDGTGQQLARAELDPPALGRRYSAGTTERDVVALTELPPLLLGGIQAVEDRRFKQHRGVDFTGIARAGWSNLAAGEVVQGGSTLTQQFVKHLFFDGKRRWTRKLHEIAMALLLEWRNDKRIILLGYVNGVFLGQQGNVAIHGFAAASRHYFGLPPQRLLPHQIALLVGALKGPSYYNPWRSPQRAIARRNTVLRVFYETGLLSHTQWVEHSARPLDVLPSPLSARHRHPAFLDLVNHQVARGGAAGDQLMVYTTLSSFHQQRAEQAIVEALQGIETRQELPKGQLQAALVLLERASGEVLAAVGSRSSSVEGFNRVLNARRPVGSIVKPLVFRTALRDGYSLASIVHDEPLQLALENGDSWSPKNFSQRSHGSVTLIEALTRSYNQATVYLGLELGVPHVLEGITQLGWQGNVKANPSLLLGAIEMTPLEVAQLYLSLAGEGRARPVSAVREVREGDQTRYRSPRVANEQLSPLNYLLTFALRRAVVEGTGRSLTTMLTDGAGLAGKTGTSNDLRDSWFVGFSEDLLAVVWVGRDDNRPAGVTGASGALQVFGQLFGSIQWQPLTDAVPTEIEFAWIESASGKLAASHCPGVDYLPFVVGSVPLDRADCIADSSDRFGPNQRRKRRWWKFWR